MIKIVLVLLLSSCCALSTARAQIGWTLAQCRQHFGHELWMEDDGPVFGIKFHHYTVKENVEIRDAPAFSYDGILFTVTFDSDGTVGKIWWRRSGQFSNQEIKELLKRSSAVAWNPAPDSPTIESSIPDPSNPDGNWLSEEPRPTHWVGEHNGIILFNAIEEFTEFDGGHDNLTVTTR